MIIEGKLLEIGVLNHNRWGIGEEGAGELLKSLAGNAYQDLQRSRSWM